jgi:hypothetical protein
MKGAQKWVDTLTYLELMEEYERILQKKSQRSRAERDFVQIKVTVLKMLEDAKSNQLPDVGVPDSQ